jgi:hypothetical protein
MLKHLNIIRLGIEYNLRHLSRGAHQENTPEEFAINPRGTFGLLKLLPSISTTEVRKYHSVMLYPFIKQASCSHYSAPPDT